MILQLLISEDLQQPFLQVHIAKGLSARSWASGNLAEGMGTQAVKGESVTSETKQTRKVPPELAN